jgi:hypothetical protein
VERTTIAGETEVLEENLHQRHFVPPQIPHDQVRFRTPDRSGGITLFSLSLMLRPTVSLPVCLGIKHPSEAYDLIFITVGQLRVC